MIAADPPRLSVLFYVQNLLGVGHVRRAAALARGLSADGMSVTVLTGGRPLGALADFGAARVIQLPPIASVDAGFALVGPDGLPVGDRLKRERAARCLEALEEARPTVLMVELFPFGRRQFGFELLPLIMAARRRNPPVLTVSSVRDILVPPRSDDKIATALDRASTLFDAVLIHGDPGFARLPDSFPEAAGLPIDPVYTGYVSSIRGPDRAATASAAARPRDGVVLSSGGGAVGLPMVRMALRAGRLSAMREARWIILLGPHFPRDTEAELARIGPKNIRIVSTTADFDSILRKAALSISQAGYNTVVDVLAAGVPALFIPFDGDGAETEQPMRAKLLAEAGLAECLSVGPTGLAGPAEVAAAIDRAAARPPASGPGLDLDGVAGTARSLRALIARRTSERVHAL